MTVSFITPGRLDLESVFTFGMSAKETNDAIGFFGTGLKFAIATLLRTGHKVSIWIGHDHHQFRTEDVTFRGKDFKKVFLDNTALSFTTELGKTWEVWMAFRELHSNTLDEKGKTFNRGVKPTDICEEHDTHSIIVVEGHGIDQAYSDMSLIFCDSMIIAENGSLQVRHGRSKYLFYRGVRVANLPRESMFTYNWLAKEDLTEDRTLKFEYWVYRELAKAATKINNEEFIHRVLTAVDGTFEKEFDFDGASPCPEFITSLKQHYGDSFLNMSARKLARTMNLFDEPEIDLDNIQKQQLERALEFLGMIGFEINDYPIKIMSLHGAMGQAKNGKILIDPQAFRMGTKQLAGTLFEEFLHLREGCFDNSRKMQNILIDTIMSMGEKMIGKPI